MIIDGKRAIEKNKGTIVFHGDSNKRACNKGCVVCGNPIIKNDGFAIVTNSSYEMIHKDCKKGFYNNKQSSNSTYINGFEFEIIFWAKTQEIDFIKSCGFEPTGFSNMIKVHSITMNELKFIKSLTTISNVKVITTNGSTNEKNIIHHKNIDADTLYNEMIANNKKLGIYKY